MTRRVRTGQRWHMNTSTVRRKRSENWHAGRAWRLREQASKGAGQPQPVELHAHPLSRLSTLATRRSLASGPVRHLFPNDSRMLTPLYYTYTNSWPMARDTRAAHSSNEGSEAFRLDLQHVSGSEHSKLLSSYTRSADRHQLYIWIRKALDVSQARPK